MVFLISLEKLFFSEWKTFGVLVLNEESGIFGVILQFFEILGPLFFGDAFLETDLFPLFGLLDTSILGLLVTSFFGLLETSF